MPNRIIREGILDSQRYWSVSIEARQLFVHLMLLADDFGLVSLAPVFVRRRCFDDAPPAARIDKMIEQLHDVDLIRVYQTPRGKFAFIPRFRQRLQRHTLQYPKPPRELYADDDHATKIFSNIKDIPEKPTDDNPLDSGSPTDEVKRSEGKRIEVRKALVPTGTTTRKTGSEKLKAYTSEFDQAWLLYPARDGSNPKRKAYGAWCARLREGHTSVDMTDGVKRYAEHCRTKGKTGTEYVMQAARFFGPGAEFLGLWGSDQQTDGQPSPHHIPDNFEPSKDEIAWATNDLLIPETSVSIETSAFREYFRNVSRQQLPDWHARWRIWMLDKAEKIHRRQQAA